MSVSLVPSHARWSFPAGSTSLAQFQFVTLNGSAQLITPASSGVWAFVLDDAPSNQNATLNANGMYTGGYVVGNYYGCVIGSCIQKVYYGGTLAAGVAVTTNTSGQAIAAGAGVVLGYTLEAGVSGELHPVHLVA